jgi:SAM-dependent methyltransferase
MNLEQEIITPNTNESTRELHLKRKAMWDASLSNHDRYLNKVTGVFSDKFTEKRNCPACSANDERSLFWKSGGCYVACNKCSMLYLNPVFKDGALEEYYRSNHHLQGEAVANDLGFYSTLYLKGLNLITKSFPNLGSILDVGCSTGIFLDIAKSKGWQTFGLELNKKEAEIARFKNHSIKEEMISTVRFDKKFSAITLWDVFEHIKDGFQFLNDAKKILKKDGIVFIQSPSRDALAAKIMQSDCNMFDGLEHVNLYGIESLTILAKSAGFKIDSYGTVISEIGVINNYLEYYNPYLGPSKNKSTIANLISENQIHEQKLGYKFQTCLKLI